MKIKKIYRYAILATTSINQALRAIEKGAIGLVFVVDSSQKLKGIITDGDVRRALLKGCALDDNIKKVMNTHPAYAKEGDSPAQINKVLSEKKVKILPIIDKKRRLVDFIKYDKDIYFPVARPIFQGNELRYVSDAIISGWVSSIGNYVTAFENNFARFCGVKYAIACSNGTTALHLALLALGIGPGDEVILPSLTFVATANAVLYVGATPILVDVEPTYWQIDPCRIEAAITPRTKAIIPVHLYGNPSKMNRIVDIAKKYNLHVVEDAAEALGAEVQREKVGSWGKIGTFSFFGNKIITTGEGGMVTTNDPLLAEKVNMLRDHGMSKDRRYWHEILGYNYRMTNMQAALGLAQLEKIFYIIRKKIKIARWYNKYLGKTKEIKLHSRAPWAKSVYWMYSIVIDLRAINISRDNFMQELKHKGIETRPFFVPIHKQPMYQEQYGNLSFPMTTKLAESGINLPSSIDLGENDIKIISNKIRMLIKRYRRFR